MIWDGVTEYQDDKPPDVVGTSGCFACTGMALAVSAKDLRQPPIPMQHLLRQQALGWDPIGVTFANPFDYLNIGFLAYDGSLSNEATQSVFRAERLPRTRRPLRSPA